MYVAVEIESPKVRCFPKDHEFSWDLFHAIDQVERWQMGVMEHSELVETTLGMSQIGTPTGVVILGRSDELSSHQRIERWNHKAANGPVALMTWDDVVNRGRQWAARFDNAQVQVAQWVMTSS